MAAGNYTIKIDQGSDFSLVVEWKDPAGAPINMTGFSAKMDIRDRAGDPDLIDSFSVGSGLTITGAAGRVTLSITASESSAWDFDRAVYDLEVTSGGGAKTRLIQGAVLLSREVTV